MDHRLIDQRDLALGRAIAAKLKADPRFVEKAKATVRRWREMCSKDVQSTLKEWADALEGPSEGIITLLTCPDERATRLRQSNPFIGVLSEAERKGILLEFARHEAARA